MSATTHDAVNHPKHYMSHPSGIECIQVTRHMNFNLGNVVKYLWRTDHKNGLEDLKKARWYLDDEINKREKEIAPKAKGRLENWYVGPADQLIGEVYGDPRFEDGFKIVTTRVVQWDGEKAWAQTKNTKYELGKPAARIEELKWQKS